MIGKKVFARLMMAMALVAAIGLTTSGCNRYCANRTYDFMDIGQLAIGVTHENPETGMWPPSLGLHAQATEFVNLGAIHFSGYTAEWDGRGLFAGREYRTRYGFFPMQVLQIDQDYVGGSENYFKKIDGQWTRRMNSRKMRWNHAPAKELEYEYWSDQLHQGTPIFHRGWQYWENVAVEAAVSEPFLTHFGLGVRVGADVSEVSDFVLGFFCLDFKKDDLTEDEYAEMTGMRGPRRDYKPASEDWPTEEIEEFGCEFAERLGAIIGDDPNIVIAGDRFYFDTAVLFDSGSAVLRPEGKAALDKFASAFNQMAPQIPGDLGLVLQAQGHTDSEPVGKPSTMRKYDDNWELSTARAVSVVKYLASKGVSEDLFSAAGFSKYRPAASNATAEGMQMNRRTEIQFTQYVR